MFGYNFLHESITAKEASALFVLLTLSNIHSSELVYFCLEYVIWLKKNKKKNNNIFFFHY